MATVAQLDKSLDTALNEGYGTITIRVVVLEKGMAPSCVMPFGTGRFVHNYSTPLCGVVRLELRQDNLLA